MATPELDYTGSQGGLLGMAFAAGWSIATAMWLGMGALIWRLFFEPRIKELKGQNDALQRRIEQLEVMLMLHGPQQLRQAMQAVTSEIHLDHREERE
ncbi:hypothetical protein DFR49_3349 [Hephaestia caeni]|uniref:Uncharacterized protein n=1 Tax=Hephaestia caeni TaxID=645617 RepID=A0A397NUS7_9SPHN|nr:hypothetical protein [Hephaestia caeni]RIA37464.1 hypothetical protein DFR49_3349 [Hephaestia caeni]